MVSYLFHEITKTNLGLQVGPEAFLPITHIGVAELVFSSGNTTVLGPWLRDAFASARGEAIRWRTRRAALNRSLAVVLVMGLVPLDEIHDCAP